MNGETHGAVHMESDFWSKKRNWFDGAYIKLIQNVIQVIITCSVDVCYVGVCYVGVC